jgi:MYXO-CTERM domain-containing protein
MVRILALVSVAGLAGVTVANPVSSATGTTTGGSVRSAIVDQQPGASGNGLISQSFPDFPNFSTLGFDDFTLSNAYNLTSLTVYGVELGLPSANVNVVYAIVDIASSSPNTIYAIGTGTQVGQNLEFDLTGVTLGAGTYWLTAWVERPFGTGGQWFWAQSDTTNGSEAFFHNPGGGFGLGTNPFPGSVLTGGIPTDLAFTLSGDVVPAPSALALLGLGGLVAGRRRR